MPALLLAALAYTYARKHAEDAALDKQSRHRKRRDGSAVSHRRPLLRYCGDMTTKTSRLRLKRCIETIDSPGQREAVEADT